MCRWRCCVIPETASGGGLVHSGGSCLGVEEDAFLFLKLVRVFHESRNVVTGDAASTHLFQITALSSFSARLEHQVQRRRRVNGCTRAAPRSSAGGSRRGQPVFEGELILALERVFIRRAKRSSRYINSIEQNDQSLL